MVCFLFNQDQFKLSQKDFVSNADGKEFVRGRYLIILGDASLESSLSDVGGDFIEFKRSQGYDVDVLSYPNIASNQNELRDYLSDYYEDYPMLEYVLLVGDVTGAYAIPTHLIASYNDADYPLDQTDTHTHSFLKMKCIVLTILLEGGQYRIRVNYWLLYQEL